MLTILPYDLPDARMLRAGSDRVDTKVFVPDRVMVVVGRGSDPEHELHVESVLADSVPVYRRETGGCAVVLSHQMLVVALALRSASPQPPLPYFRLFNELLQRALVRAGIIGVEPAGTSDLAIRGRKISGSSLYRGRDLVFFHAVINVDGDVSLMERYLRFPPRQPAYRNGRPHRDFVGSLAAHGFSLDATAFSRYVDDDFQTLVSRVAAGQAAGTEAVPLAPVPPVT
ncbi:MAG: hypothetical protein AB1714_30485 [Acidobacteriota bacterium]